MILQVDGKLKKIAVRELLPFSYGVEGQVIAGTGQEGQL